LGPFADQQYPKLAFPRARASFLAGPDGTRKFVLATVGSCLMVMLHIIAIVAFVGIGAVCYMIGDENTIYRR
jgi:hypothetical protein